VAGSTKPVGRLDFILRILAATALAIEWNRVFPLKELLNPVLHLDEGQSGLVVLLHIACYPFVAILMLSATSGRLLDAKLLRLYVLPIFIIWIFSTVSFMFGLHYWPFGLALFVLLLIMGGILPIKSAPVKIGFVDKGAKQSSDTDTSNDKVKRRKFNPGSPLAFLIALIILAGIWLPLIYLDDVSGHGVGVWLARLGYAILGFYWFGLSVNRFKDAGLLYGRSFLYVIAVSIISLLPLMLNLTNGYESLAIFFLIQTLIVLLRSKPASSEPSQQSQNQEGTIEESSHRLAALGGTMPELEDIPSRRMD
jgi:hypothetical protein